MLRVTLALALTLSLAAAVARAAAGEQLLPSRPEVALARKVQAVYDRTRDWEAAFFQTYTYSAAKRSQNSKGALRVKRPGKLRWDYTAPQTKTIVVNGSKLTQYEPEENQAYVDEHFDASAMSAAVTFLLGKGDLEREFTLALDGPQALVLTPRQPDARVARITLRVNDAGEVTGTRVVDGAGNVNDISFTGVKRNAGVPDSAFELELPKDVQFVRMP